MTARIGQAQLCIELETLRAGADLPVELALFAAGPNKTSKGEFIWSARSVQECANFDAQRGIDSVIDYEHASLGARWANDPAAAGKAAGWYKLDARAEGAFAKAVSWTKSGAQSLNSREFRYLSPTIFFDEDTREITAIVNAALTNNPATMKANPLVMSTSEAPEKDMKNLLVALGLVVTASEGEALLAVQQLRRDRDEVLSVTGKATLPEAVATVSAWKASAARVESLSAELAQLTAEKTKAGIDAVIKRGLEEKRITPAQVESLTKSFSSVETLTAFIDASPKNTVMAPPAKEPVAAPTDIASLSAEDKEIAALMGIDLKKLAETKRQLSTP